MSYDDERVIALLRESVPAAPEAADRLDAVRRKAGHQRTMVWTQTLGVAASVLLVLGFVTVATGASGRSGTVEPTSRPLEAVATAFSKAESVRFEANMKPAPGLDAEGARMSTAELARLLTSRVTGAATKEGDLQIDGDLSFMMAFAMGPGMDDDAEAETHWRFVDGKSYRSPGPHDDMPPGKKWIGEEGDSDTSPADLDRMLGLLRGIAEDVRFVRSTTVRGTPVGEYRLTIPERYAHQEIEVTFALDSDDRLRRVAAEFSWLTLMTGGEGDVDNDLSPLRLPSNPMRVVVELELFDYDADISIKAPSPSEVVPAQEIYQHMEDELSRCLEQAQMDEKKSQECFEEAYGEGAGQFAVPTSYPDCPESPAPDGGSYGPYCEGNVVFSTAVPVGPSPASTRSPSPTGSP
jgi:hypothetical protein